MPRTPRAKKPVLPDWKPQPAAQRMTREKLIELQNETPQERQERIARRRANTLRELLPERRAKERALLRFPQALAELAEIERDARSQPEHVTQFDLIARLADTLQGLVMELSKP